MRTYPIITDNSEVYLREERREAFRERDPRSLSTGWTEKEWVKVGKHVDPMTGAIIYHSYADYCAD